MFLSDFLPPSPSLKRREEEKRRRGEEERRREKSEEKRKRIYAFGRNAKFLIQLLLAKLRRNKPLPTVSKMFRCSVLFLL